jgi:hypothetical protein
MRFSRLIERQGRRATEEGMDCRTGHLWTFFIKRNKTGLVYILYEFSALRHSPVLSHCLEHQANINSISIPVTVRCYSKSFKDSKCSAMLDPLHSAIVSHLYAFEAHE